ncbi:uncharacterized protein LOC131876661 [Cryptomeria japonica]|uniref:uncharacterized protein LOC131876661 n=1 Tax=Cryptomeria japonica TaxID=3369 RepID=UPI0027D9E9A8|nr:uncharacterized protein LOC131876661 [Cryptomeria japonica]
MEMDQQVGVHVGLTPGSEVIVAEGEGSPIELKLDPAGVKRNKFVAHLGLHQKDIKENSSDRSSKQVWNRITAMIRETVEVKCEVNFPLGREEADIVSRLGLQELSPASMCVRRGRWAMKKVQRGERWMPPQNDFININTDGLSRGNAGPAGVGGVGKNSRGEVVFLFLVHKGRQSNNYMEGLVPLYALERAWELGQRKVICELDSQIMINLVTEQRVCGIQWQLARVVQ